MPEDRFDTFAWCCLSWFWLSLCGSEQLVGKRAEGCGFLTPLLLSSLSGASPWVHMGLTSACLHCGENISPEKERYGRTLFFQSFSGRSKAQSVSIELVYPLHCLWFPSAAPKCLLTILDWFLFACMVNLKNPFLYKPIPSFCCIPTWNSGLILNISNAYNSYMSFQVLIIYRDWPKNFLVKMKIT